MHLNVTVPEISVEPRVALAKNLTETVMNILDIPPERLSLVSVRIEMYGKNQFARGGVMVTNGGVGHYHIDLYAPVLPVDKKRLLVQHLTNALCDSLTLGSEQRQHVFITIHQFSPENVGTAGRLLSELAFV